MRNRLFLCSLALVLILATAAACTAKPPSPAPAPPKATTASPAASPAPPPKTTAASPTVPAAPKTTAAAPATHAKVEIQVFGATAGGSSYILCTGLSDIINKTHPWLKSSTIETFGSIDNVKRGETDPKVRASAVRMISGLTYWAALAGTAPFEHKYPDLRTLGIPVSVYGLCLISIDPKVKTKNDLVGKRISVGDRGSNISLESQFLLGDCWGIWDKITPEYSGWKAGTQQLMDGLVQAMTIVAGWGGKWGTHSSFEQIAFSKPSYFIGATKEELEVGMKKTGYKFTPSIVAANSFADKIPAEPFPLEAGLNGLMVYKDMPDEVAYEIVKTAHENYQKFPTYHSTGKGIMPETLAWVFVDTEAEIHPGALKYYKEKGLPITLAGKIPPVFK